MSIVSPDIPGSHLLYEYVNSNPINTLDPIGYFSLADTPLWLEDILSGAGDISSGFADTITFGGTSIIQDYMNVSQFIDPCSAAYKTGNIFGEAWFAGAGASLLARLSNLRYLRWLNHNRYLRLGEGRYGGDMVPSMRIGPEPWRSATPTRKYLTFWRL